jgi:hypothetical protein
MNHDDVKDMCKALSLGWGREHLNNNPYFLLASLTEWIIIEHIFIHRHLTCHITSHTFMDSFSWSSSHVILPYCQALQSHVKFTIFD